MSKRISRGAFLKGLAACAAVGGGGAVLLEWMHREPSFPCRMLGPSREIGHMLRGGAPPEFAGSGKESTQGVPFSAGQGGGAQRPEEKQVVIVGGGIAGLSAAWWLKRNGIDDFVLLELENEVGGNAASGKNAYGSYPWGAHYVPIANEESTYVRSLFEELKIIQRFDASGQPVYDDLYLCHEPQERLFKDGSYQEGLVPHRGLQQFERDEIARFFSTITTLRARRGSDGKPAFAIPVDLSSRDASLTQLDRISMSDWLARNNFRSPPLLWYVNYCCRDDYGSTSDHVSAWAGLHYFAGRRGRAANAELNSVVTWPEGNGFLVKKLKEVVHAHIRPNALAYRVANSSEDKGRVSVHFLSVEAPTAPRRPGELQGKFAIVAAPRFVARHLIDDRSFHSSDYAQLEYAPWMVANITLRDMPGVRGVPLAWDNVSYYSDSLGYVNSNHQDITTREKPIVITYYYPLSSEEPHLSRQQLLQDTPQKWSRLIVDDLEKAQSGIASCIVSMDLWPWGHGMIRPSVGFIWGDCRKRMKQKCGNILFAHSDMSGMSNFEEAQYHGVEAAKSVISQLKEIG